MLKKTTFLVFVLLIVCSSLVLAEASKTVKIGVFISNAGDPYFQNKSYGYFLGRDMLELQYPEYDIDLQLYDAGGYEYATKQYNQIEDAIQRGLDVIVITACDREALVPVIEKAMDKGIIVVNDDVLVNTDTTIEISENSVNVGRNVASFIARQLGNKGNVVMLKGPAGADLFMKRAEGAKEEFDRYPEINVVAEQWHASNIMEAQRVMEDFIQAHGETIDAVYAGNTVQAMGAAHALQAAGFDPSDVVVVGIDLHNEGIAYMKDGLLSGIVPAQPVKLARLSTVYGFKAAIGEEIPDKIYTSDEFVVDVQRLDTFDLSDSMAPEGWKPPLN